MFGLGTVELIIILVILVMIFGLGKLPKAAGKIGEAVGSFQDAVQGEDDDIEIGEEETLDEPNKLENQEASETVQDASMPHQKEQNERSADGGATW